VDIIYLIQILSYFFWVFWSILF